MTDGLDDLRDQYPPLLRVRQTAKLLGVSERMVWTMVNDGRLPAYRLPGARRWTLVRDEVIDVVRGSRVT